MTKTFLFLILSVIIAFIGCCRANNSYDASGVFEAREVIVSSQAAGQINEFNIQEGDSVKAGQLVGKIDCDDLTLYQAQVEASRDALKQKQFDALPEIHVLEKQISYQNAQISAMRTKLAVLSKERDRQQALVAKEAAPAKRLDDINGEVAVLQKQIDAAESQISVLKEQIVSAQQSVNDKNRSVMSETSPIQSQIDRITNQIANCTITNPINGTVIAKYAEGFETVTVNEPLYKVADLSEMTLRAYLTGDQLSTLTLSQKITVFIDNSETDSRRYDGVVVWISPEAEFTPKTIQTKDERANLVYAIKISVRNDGFLRIGMYGEVKL